MIFFFKKKNDLNTVKVVSWYVIGCDVPLGYITLNHPQDYFSTLTSKNVSKKIKTK